jgi:serine/threonine protein kinase
MTSGTEIPIIPDLRPEGPANWPLYSEFTEPSTEDALLSSMARTAIVESDTFRALADEAARPCRLGSYRLRRRLGAGGMGEVYFAEHTLLGRPCALKLIRPEHAGDPRNLVSFEREVRATASLTNWNTVQIYDFGHAEDGTFYYVMEYLEGMNLQDLVDRHGPLAPERVIHFLRQICGSLREAHGIGLIHCDIKPGNIIGCERGGLPDVAKLLDFGIVRSIRADCDSDNPERPVIGSPLYMSPEQAAGKGRVDPRSDLYSLGAVGYFLLTGQPPFVRESVMKTLLAHMHEQPPRPAAAGLAFPPTLRQSSCVAWRNSPRGASRMRIRWRKPWPLARSLPAGPRRGRRAGGKSGLVVFDLSTTIDGNTSAPWTLGDHPTASNLLLSFGAFAPNPIM